ncbi:MAG: hypothetical protein ACK58L_13705 [Planctomycetota bacterium]
MSEERAENRPESPESSTFDQLVASRRDWIDGVLRPWCRTASLKELKKAEAEWFDLAGRADSNATLWTWAWERFPAIVHPEMSGVNETHEVTLRLLAGSVITGYPDSRRSQRGQLTLIGLDEHGSQQQSGPISIDEILEITRQC